MTIIMKANVGQCHRHQVGQLDRVRNAVICLISIVLLVGCDLSVTNPGPIQDEFLDSPVAFPSLINSSRRTYALALNRIAYEGAVVSREVRASGSIAYMGFTVRQRQGTLVPEEVNAHWQLTQRARWVAEDAAERIREQLDPSAFENNRYAAEALIYVGYSNRLLGENMCEVVFNGGPPEPHTAALTRADAAFHEAIRIANRIGDAPLENAARSGLAIVRMWQNDWAGAVEEASRVPRSFVFAAEYGTIVPDDRNIFALGNDAAPFKQYTVWSTFFEDYYEQTRDPRTAWSTVAGHPMADDANIPWYRQLKHVSPDAPINLATGREMVLIRTEAALIGGDWQTAIDLINELRADVGVEPLNVAGVEEAWAAFKVERTVELWLEGRHLSDIRRWRMQDALGTLPADMDMSGRDSCFPISLTERESNPNVPN
jgi:starch-binding outer membrane protein, SusD/RagB family